LRFLGAAVFALTLGLGEAFLLTADLEAALLTVFLGLATTAV
jgi:hypothetical protein